MTKTYSEIYHIKDPKEKLFAIIDRIKFLKDKKGLIGLTDEQDLELRNLDSIQMQAYSDWKDPQ